VHLIARNFITELGLPLLYYHKKSCSSGVAASRICWFWDHSSGG